MGEDCSSCRTHAEGLLWTRAADPVLLPVHLVDKVERKRIFCQTSKAVCLRITTIQPAGQVTLSSTLAVRQTSLLRGPTASGLRHKHQTRGQVPRVVPTRTCNRGYVLAGCIFILVSSVCDLKERQSNGIGLQQQRS